ncbi:unnamed protein product, partial [Oppiella nova]
GDDHSGYGQPCERWHSRYTVEAIILSVMCMLSDPNTESVANDEAAEEYCEDLEAYKRRIIKCAEKSFDE